jgi:hypothetical protein
MISEKRVILATALLPASGEAEKVLLSRLAETLEWVVRELREIKKAG